MWGTNLLFAMLLSLMMLKLHNCTSVKFTNVICTSYNETWMQIHYCRLKAVSRYKTTYNFNGTIVYPSSDIIIKIKLFKRENGYKPWLYSITFDLCRFLRKAYNPIAIIVFKLFKDYSNFHHPCPFVGRQLIQNLSFPYEAIPMPMPSGDFMIQIDCDFDKFFLLSTKLYFQVQEDITKL